ncbi:MAG: DUF4301 family protein [Ignavibacteria bacterium]|nr:DUF4301 family protein [Ignavibacteria bacterium]
MTEANKKKLEKVLNSEQGKLDITVKTIIDQVETFEKGIPPVRIVRACTIGDGLRIIPEGKYSNYIEFFKNAANNERIIKFVPASGAASRMFKKLQSALFNLKTKGEELENAAISGDEESITVLEFVNNIEHFAFYDELKKNMEEAGLDLDKLKVQGEFEEILKFTLEPVGLGYSKNPKGAIKFHNYPDGERTAFEEHLVEAINYTKRNHGPAHIHFTISAEHQELVKSIITPLLEKYSKKGNKIEVNYSFQNIRTNTVAVSADNKPFRDEKGKIVFRPGGHGALLSNLNDLQADIIVIKNIDNLVPDHLRAETYKYKKLLIGYLVELHSKICSYMERLEQKDISDKSLEEIKNFVKNDLELEIKEDYKLMGSDNKRDYLFQMLNRPIRICGMVSKEGHPGGGPFWVLEKDGKVTKQVVETTQIELNNKEQKEIFESATHFSPVDFICCVRDYKNKPFDLYKFSDKDTGLITIKSKDGKELKALELPGLWNGGMANWTTVFVEVPKITFNPVKEVNDLLKTEHQPPNA